MHMASLQVSDPRMELRELGAANKEASNEPNNTETKFLVVYPGFEVYWLLLRDISLTSQHLNPSSTSQEKCLPD